MSPVPGAAFPTDRKRVRRFLERASAFRDRMKTRQLLLLSLAPLAARAGILHVGNGGTYLTIQSAIDAAAPGDTIEVAPGLYAENLLINKSPLHLKGAQAGADARGRVVGEPDPELESVIAPASGIAAELVSPAGTIVVDGFCFSAGPVAGEAVVKIGSAASGLTFSCNRVAGSDAPAVLVTGVAENATISKNSLVASGASPEVVLLNTGASLGGVHFIENELLRSGPVAGSGLRAAASADLGPGSLRPVLIRGNRFEGHATGFDAGPGSLHEAEISVNVFSGNQRGMAVAANGCLISGNLFEDNTIAGLVLAGDPVDAGQGTRNTVVEGNGFGGNGGDAPPSPHGDLVLGDQAEDAAAGNLVHRNRFGSTVAVSSEEPSGVLDLSRNYWGGPEGPDADDIAGPGSIGAAPWYADQELTILNFGTSPVEGTFTLAEGETIQGESVELAASAVLTVGSGSGLESGLLELSPGAKLNIHGGSARIGGIDMQPGAVIDVVGGELALDPLGAGEYHTIAGTFTFFNCLGSLEINADTTFSGSTLGIASDIHVAPGVTLVVLGSLILDGCNLDSSGSYDVLVNAGATFGMTRCEVSGASLLLVGSDLTLRDNVFRNSDVTVFSTVSGGSIYHNVFEDGLALNVLPGASVTTSMEGWGNVDALSAVQNRLSLHFRAPSAPGRTLDPGGNLFVQPGDSVRAGLDIGELADRAAAVEALLGYSSGHLQFDQLLPSADWGNPLFEAADETGTIGRFDTAVGLGFSFPDPDGTLLDGEVADIGMIARSLEGETRMFFRTKEDTDSSPVDTRITAGNAGAFYYREAPFTRNSPVLVIDGTAPEFGGGSAAVQIREAVPVDVLQDGVFTRQGVVNVTFDSRDELAGIDDEDVSLAFTGSSAVLNGTLAGATPVEVGGIAYTRYVFEVTVGASTPNGLYDVGATVMDRSGNAATLAIGTVEIAKYRLNVTAACQGMVAAPVTRDLELVATDASGNVLDTWILPTTFTGGQGSLVIEDIPDGTAMLSAKTAWTLRRRIPVSFDSSGDGSAAFTGASLLRGGDLNGNNLVNLVDYNILRAVFNTVAAGPDISGDGQVNLTDFNILNANWLTAGDPP